MSQQLLLVTQRACAGSQCRLVGAPTPLRRPAHVPCAVDRQGTRVARDLAQKRLRALGVAASGSSGKVPRGAKAAKGGSKKK
jgi:hypothetical protein